MAAESLEQRFAESQAVVLDIDGTLVNNYMSVISQSAQLVLAMRGQSMDPHEIIDIQLNNVRTDDILEALVHPTPEEWPQVRQLHRHIFGLNSFMPPIGEPEKFVQDIRSSDRQAAIWTSRPREFLTSMSCPGFVFDGPNRFTLFDAVSASVGQKSDKPHPDSLRRLAAELQIPEHDYDKIVVVDDMSENIQAARGLGMLTVAVTTGMMGTHPIVMDRLQAAKPDLLLDNYDQLRPYLNLPPT